MRYKISFSWLLLCFILLSGLLPGVAFAQSQSLSSQDLSTVNVDNLSDDQIMQFMQQAQASGLSQTQLEQQAAQRGLPPAQIQKLEDRLAKISNSKGQTSNGSKANDAFTRRSSLNQERQNDTSGQKKTVKNFDLIFNKIQTRIFGEDLFNNSNLTFEPNLRLPTPSNYVLAADDQLTIDIFGYSEASYKLTVSPEGYIRIPNLGPVFVNGLTIDEARAHIKKQLGSVYRGMLGSKPTTFVTINLGDIRSIRVVLVGEVKLPGTYTLPSLATVFNALYSSGGPNRNGSFRNIELIRGNKVIEQIDIYDFLINGIQKQNVRLQDQDVIKINPYSARVEFRGEVKRPAIYEIKPNEPFSKILTFAGGFTDRAYTHRVKVIQSDSREKTVYDISEETYNTYFAHRGDIYFVEPISNRFANRIQLVGAVVRPGLYAFTPGLTVSQLIKKADGLREDAFTSRATIRRLNPELVPEMLSFNVAKILSGQEPDILLQREDSVTVTSRFDLQEKYSVSIEGEVIKPDTIPWSINMHIQDLILHAGGLTDAGSTKRIEVTRRVKNADPLSRNAQTAQIFRFDINADLTGNQEASSFVLEPFDDVVVRTLPGYTVQQYATIQGEVLYGGKYAISSKTQHISDLVSLAGGLTAEAFPLGATLIRSNPKSKADIDQRRQLLTRLKTSTSPRDSNQILRTINQLDSISRKQATPVGIDLTKILKGPQTKVDLILNDGDTIKIPKKLETVQVTGDVLYPVKVRYDRGFTVSHYVNAAGGFSQNAARRRTYVVYANGSVRSTSKFLFWNNYPSVLPGAQIIVPDKGLVRKASLGEVVGVASTVTSLAILIFTVFKK